jgi:GNAT superfamily N-acetyltransferase
MQVRRATEDDRLALFKLAAAMHAETQFKGMRFDAQKSIDNLGRWIHEEQGLMLVADDGGDIVGMLAARVFSPWFSDDRMAHEELFYVRADKRGTRAGFKLMVEFVAWAKTTDANYIGAGVATATGGAAERLYKHFGLGFIGGNYSTYVDRTVQ